MDSPVEGEHLHLIATRDLTIKQAERLTNCLSSLGIIAASDYQREEPFLGSMALQEHINATLPASEEDFIAREHFLFFGASYRPWNVTNLHNALMWPMPKGGGARLTPEQIGLVVCERSEVGMPEVPKPAIESVGLLRNSKHLLGKAVQVRGVLDIARNPETTFSSLHQLGKTSLQVIKVIAGNIEGHLATQ